MCSRKNSSGLVRTVAEAEKFSPATAFSIDLTKEKIRDSASVRGRKAGKLDILIHSAGVIQQDLMTCSHRGSRFAICNQRPCTIPVESTLLPALTKAGGQIVFINSSVGIAVKRPEVGQYAATNMR